MNLLQEITPPLRVGLIASGEPPNCNAVLCDHLFVQRVLFAAFHSGSILLSIWLSLRIGSFSYSRAQFFRCDGIDAGFGRRVEAT